MTKSDVQWLADYVKDGVCALRIGWRGEELIAEWVGTLRLTARPDGTGAVIEVAPGAAPLDVDKITNGSARLLLRHLQGKLSLHGAVVAERERAVVLLGRSGHGKSTLAAAVCAAGATLYADDATALDPAAGGGWWASPLETKHWLDAEARRALGYGDPPPERGRMGKWPTSAATTASQTASRVIGIVDLVFAEVAAPTLERIDGVDALAALIPQAVRFILDDGQRHKRELETLAELASAVPIYRLTRPRDFALLPDAVELVRRLLAGPSARTLP